MLWFLIVILAHGFYALVFIIDKYIVSKRLPNPIVYSFYVGVLSFSVLLLVPFGFYFPSGLQFLWILIGGAVQVFGWVLYFKALSKGEVSKIAPFVGSFLGVFTFLLSLFFLNERLAAQQVVAFIFLIAGGLFISYRKKSFLEKSFKSIASRKKGIFPMALLAAFCFAVFWVITKYVFLQTNFVSGVVWLRMGVGLAALTLLIPRNNRKAIFKKTEKVKPGLVKFVLAGRVFSVLGAAGLYLAVYLGSVTLVNSLQGLQYAIVLFLAFILAKKYKGLKEQLDEKSIFQKVSAVILIIIGLGLLVL